MDDLFFFGIFFFDLGPDFRAPRGGRQLEADILMSIDVWIVIFLWLDRAYYGDHFEPKFDPF
jgi:hypothetical protein